MDPLSVCRLIAQAFWLLLGAGFSLLLVTLQVWRQKRYLAAALEIEQRSSFERELRSNAEGLRRANAMQRALLESFLREPVPTLRDLVESTEREFRARASAPPSEASDWETSELRTSDFIPR